MCIMILGSADDYPISLNNHMSDNKPLIGITTDVKVVDAEKSFSMDVVYAAAIAKMGGAPVFIPSLNGDKSTLGELVGKLDGLLLPGGGDMDPKFYNEPRNPHLNLMSDDRVEAELFVLEEALKRPLPVLGICNGVQTINVFFGGTLYQDIDSQLPESIEHSGGAIHGVEVMTDSLLYSVLGQNRFQVKSHHHQAVKDLGRGLNKAATASDNVIEAVERSDASAPYLIGVQWHPERDGGVVAERLFKGFLSACAYNSGSGDK